MARVRETLPLVALSDPLVKCGDLRRSVNRVGTLATNAAPKDSTEAHVVRLTCAEPFAKLMGRRTTVIATRKKPTDKRAMMRRRSTSERCILKITGIGRKISIRSVTMLRAPRMMSWPSAWEQVPV